MQPNMAHMLVTTRLRHGKFSAAIQSTRQVHGNTAHLPYRDAYTQGDRASISALYAQNNQIIPPGAGAKIVFNEKLSCVSMLTQSDQSD